MCFILAFQPAPVVWVLCHRRLSLFLNVIILPLITSHCQRWELSASRQNTWKWIKQSIYDVYRNDSRQPWKLNKHRIVKLRPVAFLATNIEVRKKKICQERTEKGQFFSSDSSNWWLVKLIEPHPFTLQYKWSLAFHKYFSHFGRNKTLKFLLHVFDRFMEWRDILDETVLIPTTNEHDLRITIETVSVPCQEPAFLWQSFWHLLQKGMCKILMMSVTLKIPTLLCHYITLELT